MALMQKLSLKQGQSLVMTPQLQQAIKLLQMSNQFRGYLQIISATQTYKNIVVTFITGRKWFEKRFSQNCIFKAGI